MCVLNFKVALTGKVVLLVSAVQFGEAEQKHPTSLELNSFSKDMYFDGSLQSAGYAVSIS